MNVALLTVGDELLAGQTTNTNASWLAARLSERGATVRRILTVPDERELIASTVAGWHDDPEFDAIIVTGGIGGTPDDVTVPAVAEGWAPGCAVDSVYVFAGIPDEMRAMFDTVADEFSGEAVVRTIYTPAPEGSLHDVLESVTTDDVSVGSYPRSEQRAASSDQGGFGSPGQPWSQLTQRLRGSNRVSRRENQRSSKRYSANNFEALAELITLRKTR
ncbi:molybdopterin binding domain protein [Natrialba chahannaoensis JCM 10990]|uniref:Molybdopterin binding domain protein n=1 Tax=Natrialba chahannaoensis JCM 10990 TaxID=1227492 RepID=M0AJK2_9EURY|nr:molybdopterin binding domain protein [Natrialba chahannaoensis JCM 10990]